MLKHWIVAVIVLVCAAGSHAAGSKPSAAGAAVPVKAVRVGGGSGERVVSGMGSIRCAQNLKVGFEVTGVVAKILVADGDRVEKGQVLAELDNSVLEADAVVKEAQAKAAIAEVKYYSAEHRKKEELFKKNAVSDTEMKKALYVLEKAHAQLAAIRAEQEAITAKKEQRILRSPIAGVVAKSYVETGSVVTPGLHRVFRLIQCEEAIAVIELGEKFYKLVRPGQEVVLQVDALGGREFTSRVSRVGPVIDRETRTFTVEVRLDNPDLALAFGMFARAKIEALKGRRAVWAPKEALLSGDGERNSVYVVKDGVAMARKVLVGTRTANRAQIVEGLKEGDIVVVAGHDNISDLTAVSVSLLDE